MVTIRRDKHYNIVNNISKTVLSIILILLASTFFYMLYDSIEVNTDKTPYNIVELKAQYKNCIVVDKHQTNNTYTLDIRNPITNKIEKQYVKDYIYYNIYFIGDTIK